MPKRYAREFRRSVCERLLAGQLVRDVASDIGVSEATLYLWERQALIDAGRAEGVKSFEADSSPRPTGRSRCWKASSRSHGLRRSSSTARRPSAQKSVPGCPSAERPAVQPASNPPEVAQRQSESW